MISTVTTSTIAAVNTASLAMFFGLVAAVTLLVMLIQKEVLTGSEGERAHALSRVLNFAIVPLVVAFLMVLAVRITEILR